MMAYLWPSLQFKRKVQKMERAGERLLNGEFYSVLPRHYILQI
jgi:hypothetical protein